LFGSVVGVISGRYIFEEPIKEFWENEQAQGRAEIPGNKAANNDSPSK
jgi:hypothetical protein